MRYLYRGTRQPLEPPGDDRRFGGRTKEPCDTGPETFRHRGAKVAALFGQSISEWPGSFDPFRTAFPFWGQNAWNLTGLSPQLDCSPKRVNAISFGMNTIQECFYVNVRDIATIIIGFGIVQTGFSLVAFFAQHQFLGGTTTGIEV